MHTNDLDIPRFPDLPSTRPRLPLFLGCREWTLVSRDDDDDDGVNNDDVPGQQAFDNAIALVKAQEAELAALAGRR